MKKQWSFVGAFILLFIGAILSVLNVDSVPVSFGFATYEWPLIIVILGSILLGALIATLLSTVKLFQETKLRKEAEKSSTAAKDSENARVNELEAKYENEIDQLKETLRLKEEEVKEARANNELNSTENTPVENKTF
ncbi:LapA family protein [Marinilactibacillus kalidii]|uniref:LapA family protein n=1 Tax=Marinilactibacillus kalidii TaxID=2820274 RepID=UPI001ABE7810|nr:lipopolysaccharide assembly protein LapA domain-containing protein [Marinilactibacillus kalidii]